MSIITESELLRMNKELNLENISIERISVQKLVKKFQPELQEMLCNSYGAKHVKKIMLSHYLFRINSVKCY